MPPIFIHYLVPIKSIQMSKHIHNCLDDMLDRIAKLEQRLDDMENSLKDHVLDDNVHLKHRSYRAPIRNSRSPPPPPPVGFGAPPKITRAQSSPSRIRLLPMPSRSKTPVPPPPPMPGSATETKEQKADKLKF